MTVPRTAPPPWAAPEITPGSDVERAAQEWIAPYDQAWHLLRTRDWVVHLRPDAPLELRLAALVHDVERMFPGGPRLDLDTQPWDDPWYLFAHSTRSAEFVDGWLRERSDVTPAQRYEVCRLVALHEVGGLRGGDDLQAADSLSFLETLADPAVWIVSGAASADRAEAKFRYSADRIRVPAAHEPATRLLTTALNGLKESTLKGSAQTCAVASA
jgi:hypothetical protein